MKLDLLKRVDDDCVHIELEIDGVISMSCGMMLIRILRRVELTS